MRRLTRFALGTLVLLVAVAAAAWWQRAQLRAWYVLRGLDAADADGRDAWAARAVELGEPIVEPLLDRLAGPDDRAGQNAALALGQLGRHWGGADARTAELAAKLARHFAHLAPPAQALVLAGLAGWLDGDAPAAAGLIPPCARALGDAASSADAAVQLAALDLAERLLRQPGHAEALPAARALGAAGLRAADAANRLRAVRLALHLGPDMLRQVEGLLRDGSADVRRAAVLAVGPADGVVREEGLLAGLHDSDAEVRRLTEAALKARGLRPEHLELGRLLTHPHAPTRLRVLDQLGEASDVDPGVWLRRLSHDESPAVRAAAARVMSRLTLIDLSDRLDQMSRGDPSPTVSQLARHFLSRRRDATPPADR